MPNINLIDSHAHLMDEQYEGEVENIISNAKNAGIEKIINIDYKNLRKYKIN